MNQEEAVPTLASQIATQFEATRFSQFSGNAHYAPLPGEDKQRRQEMVDAFLNGEQIDPDDAPLLRYERDELLRTFEKYQAMLEVLLSPAHELTAEDEQLTDKIVDKLGELFRYEELILALGSKAVDEASEHKRLASNLSIEMLGGLNKEVFSVLLADVVDLAESSDSQYGSELLLLIGRPDNNPEAALEKIELAEVTREIIKQDVMNMFPGIAELLERPSKGPVSPEAALPIFARVKRAVHLPEVWRTILVEGSSSAETSSTEKTVSMGRERAPFKDSADAVAVAFHEFGVHAKRSEGMNVSGSPDFEEGIATRLQQIISGERRTPGAQFYLSIGLQEGLDRHGAKRGYRETFEVLWRREALLMERDGARVDLTRARARAQKQVYRTRRGGAVDTRDAAYFIGGQKAATWLNEIANLSENERTAKLSRVLSNKYDPTIDEQSRYIEAHDARET